METVNGPQLLGRQETFGRRVAMRARRSFSQPAGHSFVGRQETMIALDYASMNQVAAAWWEVWEQF